MKTVSCHASRAVHIISYLWEVDGVCMVWLNGHVTDRQTDRSIESSMNVCARAYHGKRALHALVFPVQIMCMGLGLVVFYAAIFDEDRCVSSNEGGGLEGTLSRRFRWSWHASIAVLFTVVELRSSFQPSYVPGAPVLVNVVATSLGAD